MRSDHRLLPRFVPQLITPTTIAAACLAIACGGATTTISEVAPTPSAVRCGVQTSGMPATLAESSSSNRVTVSADRECDWTAASDAPWVNVTPTAGQGNGAFTVTVRENTSPDRRQGSLRVNDVVITFQQREMPCQFSVSGGEVSVDRNGGRISVAVETAEPCRWSAASGDEWVQPATPGGTGPGAAEFVVDRNSGVTRSATLTVAGTSVRLTQSGSDPVPAVPPAPVVPAPPPPSLEPLPPPPVVAPIEDDDDGGNKGKNGGGKKDG